MTQPPVQMQLHPMDKPTEDRCIELVVEKMDAYYRFKSQWLDDTFDGFWTRSPAEREALYQASEPVFDPSIPQPILEVFLEAGVWEPLVEVYDETGAIRPPVVDPISGVVQPALLGVAPAVFGPYWQRMFAVDRQEAIRMLRDYRDIQRRRLRRE